MDGISLDKPCFNQSWDNHRTFATRIGVSTDRFRSLPRTGRAALQFEQYSGLEIPTSASVPDCNAKSCWYVVERSSFSMITATVAVTYSSVPNSSKIFDSPT